MRVPPPLGVRSIGGGCRYRAASFPDKIWARQGEGAHSLSPNAWFVVDAIFCSGKKEKYGTVILRWAGAGAGDKLSRGIL